MPLFGIDTLTSRLDLITWDAFIQWNGGAPAFAGRNFLGGDRLWVGSEATTSLTAPQPDEPDNLLLLTPMIAPIQASGSPATRQQVTGGLGTLYGQIDGEAICSRLMAALTTGELLLKTSQLVNVYLQVDPTVPFSVDYWAGWADTVAKKIGSITTTADGLRIPQHPFRPCIMCAFSLSGDTFTIDPHVTATLQAAPGQHPELKSSCFGFWADAADTDSSLQKPSATPDFSKFAPTPAPIWVWRFAKTLLDSSGNPIAPAPPIAADMFNTAGSPNHFGWEYMLDTAKWQPTVNVINHGFSYGYKINDLTQIPVIAAAVLPDESRFESTCSSNITVRGGPVKIMGLYVHRGNATDTVSAATVAAVGATSLHLFTAVETGSPTGDAYYNSANHHGADDANNALPYVAGTLFQPPHSTVFFVFDWSPTGSVSGATTEPATPADLTADDNDRITSYIADVVTAYQTYLAAHPNRPYRIGFYGSGVELRAAYDNAGISGFWQSTSACRRSNQPPNWPWPHATRWQAIPNSYTEPNIGGIGGEDIDYDWGDGGDWHPMQQFNIQLTQFETDTTPTLFAKARRVFGNLIIP